MTTDREEEGLGLGVDALIYLWLWSYWLLIAPAIWKLIA